MSSAERARGARGRGRPARSRSRRGILDGDVARMKKLLLTGAGLAIAAATAWAQPDLIYVTNRGAAAGNSVSVFQLDPTPLAKPPILLKTITDLSLIAPYDIVAV